MQYPIFYTLILNVISKTFLSSGICYYVTPNRLPNSSLKHAFSSMLRWSYYVTFENITKITYIIFFYPNNFGYITTEFKTTHYGTLRTN